MPTGFRFYPTEEELISFYLHNKLEDKISNINRVIPLVDIYQLDPWHLPSTYSTSSLTFLLSHLCILNFEKKKVTTLNIQCRSLWRALPWGH